MILHVRRPWEPWIEMRSRQNVKILLSKRSPLVKYGVGLSHQLIMPSFFLSQASNLEWNYFKINNIKTLIIICPLSAFVNNDLFVMTSLLNG